MNVGCDLVDIARLSAAIDRRPALLARVFTERELADARRGGVEPGGEVERARLAARFAAKEATRKALGDLRLPFHTTEIRTEPDGCPRLYLDGVAAELEVSLSHDGGVAMAFVVGPEARGVPLPEASSLLAGRHDDAIDRLADASSDTSRADTSPPS